MSRQQALHHWLENECGLKDYQMQPLAGDASFRSYFRVSHQSQSFVVMDAPPEREKCESFIAIAHALRSIRINTPEIYKSDLTQGFLLLTDFGDQLYLKQLNQSNAKKLYQHALDTLSQLQACKKVEGWSIPTFTAEFMRQEMQWFQEWFLVNYLKLPENKLRLLHPFFDWLTETISHQPYVFMHRDYHSANLMVLPRDQVGVLDFQDAFRGPITYDLASLLRDCYIDWPDEMITDLALYYLKKIAENNNLVVSADEFLFWMDCASMQRHLKALMTFSRKYVRDHNSNYLKYIPRTLNYLSVISERYPESKLLYMFLKTIEEKVCAQ